MGSDERGASARAEPLFAIWGSDLSPYALKLRALCDYAGLPIAFLPAEGSRAENFRVQWQIARAKRRRTVLRYPSPSDLDEYPLVPYLIETASGQCRVHYDSSALAGWLDAHHPPPTGPLFPADPALGFVAQLIDEALDEFGLYMVHHKRWVTSAASNDAGQRLARELAHLLPPAVAPAAGRRFARRQVRRLPYLFSVAPEGFSPPGLPRGLVPPARAGFPPSHDLLDTAWRRHVDALEQILGQQPFVLGQRFTVADASVYGQLGMNLADASAAEQIRERAPRSWKWLCAIRDGEHAGSSGELGLHASLGPLLAVIGQTFVPLMEQNAHAFAEAHAAGERLFNEPAFDRGRACFDGELLGQPFRAVAKSFQVRVWRDLQQAWRTLPPEARRRVQALLPDFPTPES